MVLLFMNENNNSIYQASYGEVFAKNFLAGVAKGLGGLFVWLILMFITFKLLWPQISGQMEKLTNLVNNLQSNPIVQQNNNLPKDLNQLFDQYVTR